MLYKEFNGMTEDIMSQLLDIYQMKDWGCSWAQFLEIFNEVINKKINEWQKEKIGEEE